MKDNFWQMGDNGPCGPCSEIHYDMGVAASDKKLPECANGNCKFPCDCGRYVEIWNLVFMQFDRDALGKLNPLPKPSIDTGMGLERVATVMLDLQDPTKVSNYETDLFKPIIKEIEKLTGVTLKERAIGTVTAANHQVIADHIRAATFLISDGVLPDNKGRGYVLKKIIQRAISHGRAANALRGDASLVKKQEPFLFKLVSVVCELMKDAYPELLDHRETVERIIRLEEERFTRTQEIGTLYLDSLIQKTIKQSGSILSGKEAFDLYQTYGLSLDFISIAARDNGLSFDVDEFNQALSEERERARASWKGGAGKATASPAYRELNKTVFEGYRQTESRNCEVLAIIREGQGVKELKAGEHGEVVLDHTPFYADSGCHVGDTGWVYNNEHNTVVAEVQGCYAPVQGVRAHKVIARQLIHVRQKVDAVVNAEVRMETMRNPTPPHLLHP